MKNDVEEITRRIEKYKSKYIKYAFNAEEARQPDRETYIAVIRRYIHIIEKGLSMTEYRIGAGRDAFNRLCTVLHEYEKEYGSGGADYVNAINVLNCYLEKNRNSEDFKTLESNVKILCGGKERTDCIKKCTYQDKTNDIFDYEQFVKSRHSIRHFSDKHIEKESILNAMDIAMQTPSACNRCGWKNYIVTDKEKKEIVLSNQNGNKGFGDEIDVVIIITYDLRYCNLNRELFHAFIEGGMYTMGVINAIHYVGLASVPLSASLTEAQEEAIREALNIDDPEVLICMVGVGEYPETYNITASIRKNNVVFF